MHSKILLSSLTVITFLFINIGYYLYQLVVGRMLDVESFGVLSSMFALQFLLLIPSSIIGSLIMRYVAMYQHDGDLSKKHLFIYTLFRRIHKPLAWVMGSGIIVSPLFTSWLEFDHPMILPCIILTAWSMIYVSFGRSILYAEGKMGVFAVNNIGEILFRILLSILLIQLGYGYMVVYATFLLAMILSWGALLPYIGTYLRKPVGKEITLDGKDISKHLAPMMVLSVVGIGYGNIELIIAKLSLSHTDLAILSSAFLMGKIILSGLGLFAGIAAPYFSRTKANRGFLMGVYGLFLIAALVSIGVYSSYPEYIVTLLFSSRYIDAAPYLGQVAVIMSIIAFLSLIWNHGVLAGKRSFAYLGAIPIIGIIGVGFLLPFTTLSEFVDTIYCIYVIGGTFSLGIAFSILSIEWYRKIY